MYSRDSLPDGAAVGAESSGPPAPRASVSAGFGSPGSDVTVRRIDLNDALIRHPQATFVMRAAGDTMRDAGIDNEDVLLVDRSLQAGNGHIVVATVDDELIVRRLVHQGGIVKLEAASPGHAAIVIGPEQPLEVWGVVTTVIKSLLG